MSKPISLTLLVGVGAILIIQFAKGTPTQEVTNVTTESQSELYVLLDLQRKTNLVESMREDYAHLNRRYYQERCDGQYRDSEHELTCERIMAQYFLVQDYLNTLKPEQN